MDNSRGDDPLKSLRKWNEENIQLSFRGRRTSTFKNSIFVRLYSEVINGVRRDYLGNRKHKVLKTDLWNEGVQPGRALLGKAITGDKDLEEPELFGLDISVQTCKMARKRLSDRVMLVCASITHLPFRAKGFDLITDVSTIDHIPPSYTQRTLTQYGDMLSAGGMLIIIFDSRLNLFSEIYHRLSLRKIYPQWPLSPSWVKRALTSSNFEVLHGYACNGIGIMGGMHLRLPLIERFLNDRIEAIWKIVKLVERSSLTRFLSPIFPQFVITARSK